MTAAQTGKGSIVQMEKGKPKGKCRKWKLVVSLGRDARTGKYPRRPAPSTAPTLSPEGAGRVRSRDQRRRGGAPQRMDVQGLRRPFL